MKFLLSIIFTLALALLAFSQEKITIPEQAFQGIKFSASPSEKIKASIITWAGHFGGLEKEPHTVYTLMSQGGFRAPTSKEHEELIKSWITAHPQAEAIVIFTMEGMMANSPESKLKVIWIIDKEENLNIYLVRRGSCPGSTMLLNSGDETTLSREEYRAFLEKLIAAERLAKQEKLGIWNKPN